MDFRDNEFDRMDGRCDACFPRCRGIYHVIERGDTLYSLGKRYHVSVADLMRANPYVNVYNLRIGDELCIPVRQIPIRPIPIRPTPSQPSMPVRPTPSQPSMPVRPTPSQPSMPMQPTPSEPSMPMQPMPSEPSMPRNMESMPEMDMMSQEEVKAESHQSADSQFSENDSIKEVLERTGLSMSEFMEFLAEKMD